MCSKYVNFRGAAPNFRKVSDSPEVQRIQTRERDGGRKQRYGTILNAARCLPFRRETALQNWCIWVLSWRRRRRRRAADDGGGVAVARVGVGRLHLPRDASKQCARHLPRGGDHRLSLLSLMVMMLFSRGTASIWSSVPHIIAKARRRRIDASGGSLHRYIRSGGGGLDQGLEVCRPRSTAIVVVLSYFMHCDIYLINVVMLCADTSSLNTYHMSNL
jgi:hypothetical protein